MKNIRPRNSGAPDAAASTLFSVAVRGGVLASSAVCAACRASEITRSLFALRLEVFPLPAPDAPPSAGYFARRPSTPWPVLSELRFAPDTAPAPLRIHAAKPWGHCPRPLPASATQVHGVCFTRSRQQFVFCQDLFRGPHLPAATRFPSRRPALASRRRSMAQP